MHRKIEATFDWVLQTLVEIPEELWVHPVPAETWTFPQVFEHVLLSSTCPPDGTRGEPDRLFDAVEVQIIEKLQDRKNKWHCPAHLTPRRLYIEKGSLISDLHGAKLLLSGYAQAEDLTQLCLERELMEFGFITRYEWLVYICGHAERHLAQVNEMQQKMRSAI